MNGNADRQSPEDRLAENPDHAQADPSKELADRISGALPEGPIEREQVVRVVEEAVTQVSVESFVGPYPPPRTLAEYEQVLPGLANRIIERADREQAFRHEMGRAEDAYVKRAMNLEAAKVFSGQICGLIIALLAIGGGIWLLANDKATGGLAAIIGVLASLVIVFIAGKVSEAVATKTSKSADADE